MHEFFLEEKAKKFIYGDGFLKNDKFEIEDTRNKNPKVKLSREEVETTIKNFVSKNGNIRKIDFQREKNNLPSFSLINLYWGGIKQMKTKLNLPISGQEWERESIKLAIQKFIETKNNIFQSDLKSKNALPSLPCILSYYPEFHNFSEVKEFFGLKRSIKKWDYEDAVNAGKIFIGQTSGNLTQKDLMKRNNLPTMKVLERLFGTLTQYQKIIGANVSQKNDFISIDKINEEVLRYFTGKERVIKNRNDFFRSFKFSQSTIIMRFESVTKFLEKYGITETNPKKSKFSKHEVDKAIIEYIKVGNKIPTNSTRLAKLGLPSSQVILRYYDSWKEPFVYFQELYEKIQ